MRKLRRHETRTDENKGATQNINQHVLAIDHQQVKWIHYLTNTVQQGKCHQASHQQSQLRLAIHLIAYPLK
jgi:hypothetical protein